ncbi:MAG: hypothetical protein R3C60_05545 [Parvularculaceae bacterium]
MIKSAIAIAAAGAFVVTGAYAMGKKGDGEGRPVKMTKMDEMVESHFLAMDKNEDGLVSEQEMIDFVTAKAKANFAAAAGDDHMMTVEEMKAMHMSKHKKMMEERKGMMMDDGDSSDAMDHDNMDHDKMDDN